MSFRRRTFPEVLDNLLTDLTKGVAAEEHPFPPESGGPPFRHSLQQPPVAAIVSVYGSRDGEPHLFRPNTDYKLENDKQTLTWQAGAEVPDAGTLIQVNYYPTGAQPVLTDIQTGSVVRTLVETMGLEMARLYAQLEAVYDAAFVDTASGKALENVVALLGIERVAGGRAAGEVEFTRATGSRGLINIPAGTRIITADGNVEYETTVEVTMAQAQNTIRTTARDLESNDPLPADALTVLPVPIAGIATVTNPAPTTIATQNETDAELRTRAKNFLHGSERATLGAIQSAIARQGVTAEVVEAADQPGLLEITPHVESLPPELDQRLRKAIDEVRPAGVRYTIHGAEAPAKVSLSLRLTTTSGLLEQDLRAAQHTVRTKVADYFARLATKAPGSINRIVGLILSVPGVEDVTILSATWDRTPTNVLDLVNGQLAIADAPTVLGDLQIADPNLPTLLNVTVTYPDSAAPPDAPAMQAVLSTTLAYLNNLNGVDNAPLAKRTLSFGKLLYALPLPNKPAESLELFDNSAEGAAPALPDSTTITPYGVQFVFTLESGLSKVVAQSADAYVLTPFERLSLSGVGVSTEADHG
ncbi:MAG: baseplate J/gp47 family protein [Caldilineaceae bacterium]